MIYNKPTGEVFASQANTGESADFPDIPRGWGITKEQTESKPPMSWMNGAFRRIDENMEYLRQNGIPEWDEKLTYPAGAITKIGSDFYLSKAANVDQAPAASDNWEKLIFKADDLNEKYLQAANAFSELAPLGLVSAALENLGLGDATGYVGRFLNVQFFDTSGMYTPTAGTKRIIVEAIGGGGASGGVGGTDPLKVSMSGCGTNGAYAKALFANVSATYITIGAGGAGVINSRGNNGGTTSFGSYLTCPGGGGAPAGQSNIDPSLIYNSATNATEAPQPTVNNGIMIKTMTPSPTVSRCVSLGYGSALLCYPPFTHIGGHYGAGGNSVYITQNTPAQPGFSGGDGKVIIWEYA